MQEHIPVLKPNAFYDTYFRHTPETGSALSFGPYFEIQPKCIWKDHIGAHRLDFYMVFIVTKGEGIHTFGLKEHYIRENMLCFVGPNMISSWHLETDEQRGYFCAFSEDFFNQGLENKHYLQELPFFQIDGNAIMHLNDEQTEYYLSLFKSMQAEYANVNEYSAPVLRSQLQVVLSKAHAQFRTAGAKCPQPNHPGLRLTKAFTALYLRDFKALGTAPYLKLKKISEYADELGVSQNHLNDSIKHVTGRSAGQLLKDQLTRQASMCLKHADKSVSEIAYKLGFEDPSYFARFFRNQTGKSPSAFRTIDNL